ncbi:hypothetical protein Spiaf_1238 [Spirochaeta africana DSM 8902]|uniref:Uncharacterized protein n=2 Tax=Spirochaeta TaxID=146 RepID=H9UIH2_SPIAZ|nr:hypothetical protein Spiaf_1238 [Spirochaeta africana DSM 8902]
MVFSAIMLSATDEILIIEDTALYRQPDIDAFSRLDLSANTIYSVRSTSTRDNAHLFSVIDSVDDQLWLGLEIQGLTGWVPASSFLIDPVVIDESEQTIWGISYQVSSRSPDKIRVPTKAEFITYDRGSNQVIDQFALDPPDDNPRMQALDNDHIELRITPGLRTGPGGFGAVLILERSNPNPEDPVFSYYTNIGWQDEPTMRLQDFSFYGYRITADYTLQVLLVPEVVSNKMRVEFRAIDNTWKLTSLRTHSTTVRDYYNQGAILDISSVNIGSLPGRWIRTEDGAAPTLNSLNTVMHRGSMPYLPLPFHGTDYLLDRYVVLEPGTRLFTDPAGDPSRSREIDFVPSRLLVRAVPAVGRIIDRTTAPPKGSSEDWIQVITPTGRRGWAPESSLVRH